MPIIPTEQSKMAPSGCIGYATFGIIALCSVVVVAGNLADDFELTWGGDKAKIYGSENYLSLVLDKVSGSGFRSKKEYLFGRIDMQIKLIAGNSAGTVTAYYMSSEGDKHDEIDFEFLGNLSGQPYVLHTNVFTQGRGDREQQFYLWFDPTSSFHTYSIVWNPRHIIFLVDDTPIRVFRNDEVIGVPFPRNQAMKIYSSLWNADDWATCGGRVKTDWTKAPFTAFYRSFNFNRPCVGSTACTNRYLTVSDGRDGRGQELNDDGRRRLQWVQRNYMIYNYCTDFKRFPEGIPAECRSGLP